MLLLENLISSNLVDSDFFFNQVILFSSHLLGRVFFFFWGGVGDGKISFFWIVIQAHNSVSLQEKNYGSIKIMKLRNA